MIAFFLLVVTIIEIMQKSIFTEKLHWSQQKLLFSLAKNRFFHLSDISGNENNFSQGKRFFIEFFIPASGNEFSVQQKQYCFIQSSVEDFKIRRQRTFLRETSFKLLKTDFLASISIFFFFFIFQILLLVKGIFCLVETYF